MAKKVIKKPSKEKFACPHCEEEFHFPANYCIICKEHRHVLFFGNISEHPGMCTHCYNGGWPGARTWLREHGMWRPIPNIDGSWDEPEWWDMMDEWKNSTLTDAWLINDYSISEI